MSAPQPAPADHRLAGKESVIVDDIAGEPLLRAPDPAGTPISTLCPDLAVVPLEGVEPSHVVPATRAGDHGRLVTAFRKCAEARLTGPGPTGRGDLMPAQSGK